MKYIIYIAVAIVVLGCRSYEHQSDFGLQKQLQEDFDTTEKPLYLTSSIPIDSADPNKIVLDIWRIESEKYPDEIKLYARVFDSTGNFISHMAKPYLKDSSKKYFTGLSEMLGKVIKRGPVKVENFTVREYGANDSIPYNIVLSVDYSGSMSGVMNSIFEGTEIFAALKFDVDRIAITSFNREFSVKVPFSDDKNFIISQYRSKRNENFGFFSAFYDAVYNCLKMFEDTQKDVPRVLVTFSDGDDNYSKKQMGDLVKFAQESNVHIFTVAFGYSEDENLRDLAKYTGGKHYKAYTKEELIAIFRDIYMSLRNYYLVTYKPPKFWGLHKAELSVTIPTRKDTLKGYGEYGTEPYMTEGVVFERPILFDFDKAILKPESGPVIDEVYDQLMAYPKMKLEIQGHTDNVGGVEYNQVLSDARAKIVMDELIKRGVEPKRLRSRGFGMSMPKVDNLTEENRSRNRRTEFHVLAK